MNQMQQEKELTENILKVVSVGISYTLTFWDTFRAYLDAPPNLRYVRVGKVYVQ